MVIMQFKPYRHGEPGYAKRRRTTDWESKKEMLTELHRRGVSRKVMREELQAEGFEVSKGQLVKQMMKWGLMPRGEPATRVMDVEQEQLNMDHEAHPEQPKLLTEIKEPPIQVHQFSSSSNSSEKSPVFTTQEVATDQLLHSPNLSPISSSAFRMHLSSNFATSSHSSIVCEKICWSDAFPIRDSKCFCTCSFEGGRINRLEQFEPFLRQIEAMRSTGFLPNACPPYSLLRCLLLLRAVAESDTGMLSSIELRKFLQIELEMCSYMLYRPHVNNEVLKAIHGRLRRVSADLHRVHMTSTDTTKTIIYQDYGFSEIFINTKHLEVSDPGPYGHDLDISTRKSSQIWVFLRDCMFVLHESVQAIADSMKREFQQSIFQRSIKDYVRSDLPLALSRQLILNAYRIRWCLLGDLRARHLSILFDAVAMMIVLEIKSQLWTRQTLGDELRRAVEKLTPAEEDFSFNMHRWSNLLSHACWLVDPDRALFDPELFHSGPCKARKIWALLNCNMQEFNKPRHQGENIDEVVHSTEKDTDERTPDDLMVGLSLDTEEVNGFSSERSQADIRASTYQRRAVTGNICAKFLNQPSLPSSSSKPSISGSNSLGSFMSCAYRLKKSAAPVVSSTHGSAWSGHMSVDSWKLENTFGGRRAV